MGRGRRWSAEGREAKGIVGCWAVGVVVGDGEVGGADELVVDGGHAVAAAGGFNEPLVVLPGLDFFDPDGLARPAQLRHRTHPWHLMAPTAQRLLLHLLLPLLPSPDEDMEVAVVHGGGGLAGFGNDDATVWAFEGAAMAGEEGDAAVDAAAAGRIGDGG